MAVLPLRDQEAAEMFRDLSRTRLNLLQYLLSMHSGSEVMVKVKIAINTILIMLMIMMMVIMMMVIMMMMIIMMMMMMVHCDDDDAL